MYHPVRRKMIFTVTVLLALLPINLSIHLEVTTENIDNNVIDFDEEYSIKINKNYEIDPLLSKKASHRYTIVKTKLGNQKESDENFNVSDIDENTDTAEDTTYSDYNVVPIELLSTTENPLITITDSAEADLTVIPLSTTAKISDIVIYETATLPTSTQSVDSTTDFIPLENDVTTVSEEVSSEETKPSVTDFNVTYKSNKENVTDRSNQENVTFRSNKENVTFRSNIENTTTKVDLENQHKKAFSKTEFNSGNTIVKTTQKAIERIKITTTTPFPIVKNNKSGYNEKRVYGRVSNNRTSASNTADLKTKGMLTEEILSSNSTNKTDTTKRNFDSDLSIEEEEVPEDYYDEKDVVPTLAPNTELNSGNTTVKTMQKAIERIKIITTTPIPIVKNNKSGYNEKRVYGRVSNIRTSASNTTDLKTKGMLTEEIFSSNSTNKTDTTKINFDSDLSIEEEEVPEDYYDEKDVVPTSAPKTDALSVLFGFAGSMVESVAERVVPKGIYDLFKRMQKQNEALEAERLRSREENGGLGQFGRIILKSITKPFSQLVGSERADDKSAVDNDRGSLDSDKGFIGGLATSVTSVANVASSVLDAFKDRVQTIYPGTLWCGGGHSAQARSSDLGLFSFTDTCCRQHDACKMYILAGETKFGLNNTGLFTRSHCSCDAEFRSCLRKTNSLVSTQIGLTYFNVLGPQCFRKAHPIVRCVRKTRITGQKCEEYELDFTKPKMWQWFDNETF